jgi:signal transduction histidine kinase
LAGQTVQASANSASAAVKDEEMIFMLRIVYNSAIHLSNVIEDMLDVTRIENKQFEIFKSLFNFRQAVTDVCDIMCFQLQQKGLGFAVSVKDSVPAEVFSDMKRVKQVLFNLIGNAVKFTF